MPNKIFAPLLDNGLRLVKAEWAYSAIRSFGGRLHRTCRVSNPYPCRSMNMATGAFLRSDCDEMVIIDTDLGFEPHDLDMLLSHDEPLVFGCYYKKKLPLERCYVPFGQNERIKKLKEFCKAHPLETPPSELTTEENPFGGDEPLVEVMRCGRGFMRVRREVFEKMIPLAKSYDTHGPIEHDFWQEGVFDDEWLSEDWKFCDDWRALGGKILIDQRIKLMHYGDYGFGESEYIARLEQSNRALSYELEQERDEQRNSAIERSLLE